MRRFVVACVSFAYTRTRTRLLSLSLSLSLSFSHSPSLSLFHSIFLTLCLFLFLCRSSAFLPSRNLSLSLFDRRPIFGYVVEVRAGTPRSISWMCAIRKTAVRKETCVNRAGGQRLRQRRGARCTWLRHPRTFCCSEWREREEKESDRNTSFLLPLLRRSLCLTGSKECRWLVRYSWVTEVLSPLRDPRRRLRILARFRRRSNHPREDEAYHLGNEDAPRVILLVRCRHRHPRLRCMAGKHQAEDVRPTRWVLLRYCLLRIILSVLRFRWCFLLAGQRRRLERRWHRDVLTQHVPFKSSRSNQG